MAALAGAGRFGAAPGVIRAVAGDREQGAEVSFEVRIERDRVAEARFQAFGCPHFLAGASWLTDNIRGAAREELERWDWRELASALEVPPAKYGRLLTLQDAVRGIAAAWPGPGASAV
jgi:nitrogen fixation NifU-like protein